MSVLFLAIFVNKYDQSGYFKLILDNEAQMLYIVEEIKPDEVAFVWIKIKY